MPVSRTSSGICRCGDTRSDHYLGQATAVIPLKCFKCACLTYVPEYSQVPAGLAYLVNNSTAAAVLPNGWCAECRHEIGGHAAKTLQCRVPGCYCTMKQHQTFGDGSGTMGYRASAVLSDVQKIQKNTIRRMRPWHCMKSQLLEH